MSHHDLGFGVGSDPTVGFNLSQENMVEVSPVNSAYWHPSALLCSTMAQVYLFRDRVILGSFAINTAGPVSLRFNTRRPDEDYLKASWMGGSALSRAYVTSALRSYPIMMMHQDDRLPPFIHPQLCVPAAKGSQVVGDQLEALIPQPLAISASIMRMYSARSRGNSAFIWRTIELEQQRIDLEYQSYDQRTLTSALQSMTIYAILRLIDQSGDVASGDMAMLVRLMETTQKMSERLPRLSFMSSELPCQVPTWQDWIIVESQRRTAIILVILVHMFNIDWGPEYPQCGGFAETPLPCNKALWQAPDQATWEAEYRKAMSERAKRDEKGLKYGDLLLDLEGGGAGSAIRMQRMSGWFMEMDDFGTLVTMAVSAL